MDKENCPHCGVSLFGEPIPEENQADYGVTHFFRQIGIEVRGVYDGLLFYQCPDCGGQWEREMLTDRFDYQPHPRDSKKLLIFRKRTGKVVYSGSSDIEGLDIELEY